MKYLNGLRRSTRFKKEIGKKTGLRKVVYEWNKLSRTVVEANSIEKLIWRLDGLMGGEGRWQLTSYKQRCHL